MSKKINEKIYRWDGINSDQEILIRKMLYADPGDILSKYSEGILKDVFLRNIHRFKKKNRSFWKLILGVSDDEVDEAAAKCFRSSSELWDR
ncbi:MAG: hypothetical protein C0173_01835 [Desulfurella sp.]|uniref:Uncharacterized protein n=1 Tax=Thermodesulfobium acidiphilum TaxID=1794699 RepID=A0A2R4W022_THEAF|nr:MULTISPECIES: hypothetical protein [Bacteria]AWB10149.1 hypothetical protein TDSAC_0786 [Thermodesulfobium acidiphilum]PMP92756.1 MAG: hypothetical protein C0173_01835 [Desulfurella sp.]